MESDYVPVGGTQNIDSRQHNKLNEILNRQIDDAAKVLFIYDKNGNLKDDGTLTFTYDALNGCAGKTISNGGLTGDVSNSNTQFLYWHWQVIEEQNGHYTAKQYVWGQYIDECIQMKTLTTTGPESLPAGDYYPLQDLLYRTTALTNSSGSIVEAYDYDAYGNTLIFKAAGTGGNWWADNATQANYGACDVLYCGYRYDPEAKQYQVRNREYNPALGRWVQRDPIGFEGGDWNLYAYAGDKPVLNVDHSGLFIIVIIVAAAIIAYGSWAVLDAINRGEYNFSAEKDGLNFDKKQHCYVSCLLDRRFGLLFPYVVYYGGVLNETYGGGHNDPEDVVANAKGIEVSIQVTKSCYDLCNICPDEILGK